MPVGFALDGSLFFQVMYAFTLGFWVDAFPYHSFLEVHLYESLPVVPVKCADFLNERSEIVCFPPAGE